MSANATATLFNATATAVLGAIASNVSLSNGTDVPTSTISFGNSTSNSTVDFPVPDVDLNEGNYFLVSGSKLKPSDKPA